MFRFGDYEVDPRRRELRRAGEHVHLEPQAFDLLVHLIEHRDEVVANRDLLDGVWGHQFVSDAAITTRIKEIRRAVGDDGTSQHTIRNVRGRGYRFIAEIDAREPGGDSPTLVGRGRELEEIVDCVSVARVVTITGPGGVGKSTLARAVARRATGFRDGVHLAELAPLERPEQVLPAVARVLGVVLEPEAPEHAIATMARLDALLVLDNCEHVADEVGALIERALATPGDALHVLATSQVRLGVSGEQVIGLTPLDPDEAVRLFEARARAIRRDWDTDAVEADRLHDLLDRLDRLPLTIEMAAARLGSMSFDELEAAVGVGRSWPVQMTHRTPSRRHRSLESLVEWSAELLSEDHRRVFEDCSVFADAIAVEDAAAVIAPDAPGDAMAAIAELVDRSLLSVELTGPTARYRMLGSVRGVARRWLDASGRAGEVYRRHALSTAATIRVLDGGLRGDDEPAARRRFDMLVPELRQAHRWAVDHEPEIAEQLAAGLHVASYGRLWSEPATWSSALVEQVGGRSAGFPASRLLIAGAAVNAGQLEAARPILDDVLATSDDPRILGTAHEILSDLDMYAGDLEGCALHVEALDAIGRDLDDPHMIALAATNDSLRLTFSGDAAAGRLRLDDVDRSDLSPSSRAWLAYARGEACTATADHPGAVAAYDTAVELAASVGNPFVVSVGQSSLAAEHARAGLDREALRYYATCLDGYRRHGNVVHAVTTLRNLVTLLATIGADRDAAIIGTATSRPGLRPSYGSESAALASELETVRDRNGAAVFDEWVAEGFGLELDLAIAHAIGAVTRLAGS